jgi:mannose-6-phosphate isomerase
MLKQRLYRLEPQYRERVWGGQRLKAADPPVGEAWIAFDESRVQSGEHAGQTVAGLTAFYGAHFLGTDAAARFGLRFPLLIKLLDCADWLSVQVHPNDEQAQRLVGPGHFGKTEAWYFVEAEPGSTIYAGVKAGTTGAALETAIREGSILDVAQRLEVRAGETVLLEAGTLHSLGPGLLLYEVQQASDTTYRVYDWGRPAAAGRKLHIEEAVAVTDPRKTAVPKPLPALQRTAAVQAVSCPFFELDVVQLKGSSFRSDTQGRAFDVLTVTAGNIKVACESEAVQLGSYETILVAGGAGDYEIEAVDDAATLLRASSPTAHT